MATNRRIFFPRKKPLTLAEQSHLLRATFPRSVIKIQGGNTLVWDGVVQPTAMSSEYNVRIVYTLGKQPDVSVIEPELKPDKNGSLPHVFSGNRLCLFKNENGRYEWGSDLQIANTLVPWISHWLFHYEIWKITGEWHGGGEHPNQTGCLTQGVDDETNTFN